MHDGSILVSGVGGLGCVWAKRAHNHCSERADLLLLDADESSFEGALNAHCLTLGEPSPEGCAGLPQLAEAHIRRIISLVDRVLEPVELMIMMVAMGGGVGSGAAHALAARARDKGAVVITVCALPFEDQPVRSQISQEWVGRLQESSDVCVHLSLDRLAMQARSRGLDWRERPSWVEELVQGLVLTLGDVGLINLDLMDLRSVIRCGGSATMLVAEGDPNDPEALFLSALSAPLADLQVQGARGCLLQVEGSKQMTVAQMHDVSDAFTRGLDSDAVVILGARHSQELVDVVRVVAVVSGL